MAAVCTSKPPVGEDAVLPGHVYEVIRSPETSQTWRFGDSISTKAGFAPYSRLRFTSTTVPPRRQIEGQDVASRALRRTRKHGTRESKLVGRRPGQRRTLRSAIHSTGHVQEHIVEKGNLDQPLMLYNRSKHRSVDLSSALPAGKTEVIESLEDGVAKADVIFTCLANDAAGVLAVLAPSAQCPALTPPPLKSTRPSRWR